MNIAVFHDSHGEGGARRALYYTLKPLAERHTFDLYTFAPLQESSIPLSEIFETVHVMPLDGYHPRRSRSRLANELRDLWQTLTYLRRLDTVGLIDRRFLSPQRNPSWSGA